MRWFIEKLGHRMLTERVKHLFSTIGPDDILKETPEGWMFRGKPLSSDQVQQLREEAKLLKQMKLWQVLQDDIKYQANKKMFTESQTVQDLIAGKLLLFYLDIMNTRLKKL